jgi:Flp pilus assembly pilin Flp
MELAAKMFIRARELVVHSTRGQTMTEYALILAAIAVVVYGTYKTLGNSIN